MRWCGYCTSCKSWSSLGFAMYGFLSAHSSSFHVWSAVCQASASLNKRGLFQQGSDLSALRQLLDPPAHWWCSAAVAPHRPLTQNHLLRLPAPAGCPWSCSVCTTVNRTWTKGLPLGLGKSRWSAWSRESRMSRSCDQQLRARLGCTSCRTPSWCKQQYPAQTECKIACI